MRLKQAIVRNELLTLFDARPTPAPYTFQALLDERTRQDFRDRQQTLLQGFKTDMLALFTATLDAKSDECERSFHHEMTVMWQAHRQQPDTDRLSAAMIELIDRRLALIADRSASMLAYEQLVARASSMPS